MFTGFSLCCRERHAKRRWCKIMLETNFMLRSSTLSMKSSRKTIIVTEKTVTFILYFDKKIWCEECSQLYENPKNCREGEWQLLSWKHFLHFWVDCGSCSKRHYWHLTIKESRDSWEFPSLSASTQWMKGNSETPLSLIHCTGLTIAVVNKNCHSWGECIQIFNSLVHYFRGRAVLVRQSLL